MATAPKVRQFAGDFRMWEIAQDGTHTPVIPDATDPTRNQPIETNALTFTYNEGDETVIKSKRRGARYNQPRCIECHTNNGRSKPLGLGAKLDTMSFLTANADGTGADPVYGHNVQQHAQDAKAPAYDVSVKAFDTTVRTLPDGEKVELVKPVFQFAGPTPARHRPPRRHPARRRARGDPPP